MTNDKPPVAPKEGHYAMLRNGEVVGPIGPFKKLPYLFTARLPHMSWRKDGVSDWDDSDFDIIATISPEAMEWASNPQCDYGIKSVQGLIAAADAACDYADANCRAFPIATAPADGTSIQVWDGSETTPFWDTASYFQARGVFINEGGYELRVEDLTHWRPLPPPPSNPPLPAVFTQLGQALEKIKEGK